MKFILKNSAFFTLIILLSGGFVHFLPSAFADAPFVSWSNIGMGYGNGINTVAFRRSSILTEGGYQFAAYYEPTTGGGNGSAIIARRLAGDNSANAWTLFDTGFTPVNLGDDHDVISFGIDGEGIMHMAWGMHGDLLRYSKSTASVLNTNPITFGSMLNDMTGGGNENATTYPEFYKLPDGDLLFEFRTGSSGQGDTKLNRYDTATDTWSRVQAPLIDGVVGSYNVNAYSNNLVFDSLGRIRMTWTWRETSDFQTNHDIMYAQSTDYGVTWQKQNGSSQTLPITQGNAQIIKTIPQGSSLMNQTSMAIDSQDRPMIATWWSPGGDTNPNIARQYMLVWYNGSTWQTSQISNRTVSDPKITNNDAARIREVGRPLVVTDRDDRLIVITRSDDRTNVVTAYYSTDKTTWNSIDLTTANSGRYEPTYDPALWVNQGILDLFYEPANLNGSGTATQVSALEWNARYYFNSITTYNWVGGNGAGPTNWGVAADWSFGNYPPDDKLVTVRFGNQATANNIVDMISAGRKVGNITFTSGTGTTIQSTGGYSLTLDNNGGSSTINVAGNHSILAPVILNNDLDINGSGTLNFSGGVTGSFAMDVLSGTVTAKSIQVATLTIGSGAIISIQPIPGGPLSGDLTPVPEPAGFILLVTGAVCLLTLAWRRKVR